MASNRFFTIFIGLVRPVPQISEQPFPADI
jgi:hypothetical protein